MVELRGLEALTPSLPAIVCGSAGFTIALFLYTLKSGSVATLATNRVGSCEGFRGRPRLKVDGGIGVRGADSLNQRIERAG